VKRTGFIIWFLFVLAGAVVLRRQLHAPADRVLGQSSNQPQRNTLSVTVTPEDFFPKRLYIPKIDVQSTIEQVGLDAQKRMDVPKLDMDVGWYKLGVKPGAQGSAVIAGHFDTKLGVPAVFYRLSELEEGDTIFVDDSSGKRQTFIVSKTASYDDAEFPINLVFTQNDAKRLNLITCAGDFNREERNYTKRLVVFSILKE